MADWSWVESVVCDPKREACARPWNMDLDGAPSVVATNGRIMLIVRGDWGVPAPDEVAGKLRVAMSPRGEQRLPFAWESFRAFVGAPPEPPKPCPDCNDTGLGPKCEDCDEDGYSDCECVDCGNVHEVKCKHCDGTGQPECETCSGGPRDVIEPVRIGLAPFNRVMMAPVVSLLEAEEAVFSQPMPHRAAWIDTREWSLLVMPLRDDPATIGNAPRFELGAVAA